MLFDYKSLYKNSTDAELAAIVQRPEKYQPEAVAAANEVLRERGVEPGSVAVGNPEDADTTVADKAANWLKNKSSAYLNSGTQPVVFEREPEDGERSLIFDDIPNVVVRKNEVVHIRGLSIIWGLLFVMGLVFQFMSVTQGLSGRYRQMMLVYFVMGFVLNVIGLTGVIQLYRFKKSGWLIMTGYLAYELTRDILFGKGFSFNWLTIVELSLYLYSFVYLILPRRRAIYSIVGKEFLLTVVVGIAAFIGQHYLIYYGARQLF